MTSVDLVDGVKTVAAIAVHEFLDEGSLKWFPAERAPSLGTG